MTFTMEIYYCHGEDRRVGESAWFVSGGMRYVRTIIVRLLSGEKNVPIVPFFFRIKIVGRKGDDRKNLVSNQSYLPYRNESHAISATHTHTHKRCGTHHRTVHCSSQQSRLRQAYQLSIIEVDLTVSVFTYPSSFRPWFSFVLPLLCVLGVPDRARCHDMVLQPTPYCTVDHSIHHNHKSPSVCCLVCGRYTCRFRRRLSTIYSSASDNLQ
mmetsp:Transcript_45016/g.50805  ORF Transcript_45016/g.50805 Transcript_45016/m.50805 type:complete len:211 (-) Transcript_45016:65-697(-)